MIKWNRFSVCLYLFAFLTHIQILLCSTTFFKLRFWYSCFVVQRKTWEEAILWNTNFQWFNMYRHCLNSTTKEGECHFCPIEWTKVTMHFWTHPVFLGEKWARNSHKVVQITLVLMTSYQLGLHAVVSPAKESIPSWKKKQEWAISIMTSSAMVQTYEVLGYISAGIW